MCQSFYPSTVSLHPSIHLLIHPSFHPSIMKQMAFQESVSVLMVSLCPGHTITPSNKQPQNPTGHTDIALILLLPTGMDHYLPAWKMFHQLVIHALKKACRHMKWFQSAWVASLCVCEGQSTKRSPQRALSAFGPWGLSRGIIDDVFITRCGVMWGLGHSMSVCACVCCGGRQVDSAASSLTPTSPAIGTYNFLL